MASIKYTPGSSKGKTTYNSDIVSGIVALSLKETEGIELVPSKSKGIKLNFERDGVFVDVSVIAHYGNNVPEIAYRIQQTIKQMVEAMTHFKILKIDVHIQSVTFPAVKAEGSESTDPAESGDSVEDGDGKQSR